MDLAELVAHLRAAGVSSVKLELAAGVPASETAPIGVPLPDVAWPKPAEGKEEARATAKAPASPHQDRFAATGIEPVDLAELMRQVDEERAAAKREAAQNEEG